MLGTRSTYRSPFSRHCLDAENERASPDEVRNRICSLLNFGRSVFAIKQTEFAKSTD